MQGKVAVGLPQMLDRPQLVGQTDLAIYRAGGVVPGERLDDLPVVAEAAPGESVADRPQLPGQAFIDVGLQLPARLLGRIAAVGRRWGVLWSPSAALQPLDHPGALPSAFLDLIEQAEEQTLKLVEVSRLLQGPQLLDQLHDAVEDGPLRRVGHDLT